MYCAGCGSQLQSGLNYCNRCGRRVADDSGKSWQAATPMSVVGQTAAYGFGGFVIVLLVMAKTGLDPTVIGGISFFYFAALFEIRELHLVTSLLYTFDRWWRKPLEKTPEVVLETSGEAENV